MNTAIVETQLAAYNARDAAAFAACYAPDVQTIDLIAGEARHVGHAVFAAAYAEQFERWPDQRATVVSRQIAGQLVIDTEFITGVPGRADAHVVVMYHVADGLINRVWFSPRF